MSSNSTAIPEGLTITKASTDDVPHIHAMVHSAYSKYVERIGRPPAPMTADYNELLTTHDVWVLREAGSDSIMGSIVLGVDSDSGSVTVNSFVVDQAAQGRGYGRALMGFAEDEARRQGYAAVTLFTNAKMHENLVLYPKMGFRETGRRTESGYARVYFRKDL